MAKHYQGLLNGRSLMQPLAPGNNVNEDEYNRIFGEKKLNIISDEYREKLAVNSTISQWDIIKNRDLGNKDISEKHND